MHDPTQAELERNFKELAMTFKGIVSWKWDDRFETVLGEFSTDKKNSVRAILDQYLSNTWDSSNIGNAPKTIQKINKYLGKLRSGQLLFSSDPKQDAYIYCAWWPWGDGKTISIRVAPCYKKLSDSDKDEKIQQLKIWFGIRAT
ncbi:MAG TPA: hypothetical protein PLA32_09725 [Smithella sp.]|nr:hypothetical protein [Smithella sp.]